MRPESDDYGITDRQYLRVITGEDDPKKLIEHVERQLRLLEDLQFYGPIIDEWI